MGEEGVSSKGVDTLGVEDEGAFELRYVSLVRPLQSPSTVNSPHLHGEVLGGEAEAVTGG